MMRHVPPEYAQPVNGSTTPLSKRSSFSSSMNEQIQSYVQRGAASIDRIRSSLNDAPLPSGLETPTESDHRAHKGATAVKSHKISYIAPSAPYDARPDSFVRKSKSNTEDTAQVVVNTAEMVEISSISKEIKDASTSSSTTSAASDKARDFQLPGAIQHSSNHANPMQKSKSDTDQPQEVSELAQTAFNSCQTSPQAESPTLDAHESFTQVPESPARFDIASFTDEQNECFQASVLYLQLTVRGFSFSIGSHSRHCKTALRILMSVKYISMLVAIISLYSGVPWLSKFQDIKATALHPWWAIYLDNSAIAWIETACVAFLFFDLALNMFAQGARTYYREHPVANLSYTLILIWYLIDLINSTNDPTSRSWSQGLRPIALVRSVPKLEQVVSVFASTLMKSLKLTFFAATFLLIIGCLSVIVTRYACEKMSIAEYCTSLRKNWGSLDVSMLASFVIITSSGYARLFEDFMSILFSATKGDKTGALNFSMVLLMCAIVFGGALGLTALYTASVFDSFKKARANQYLKQLGMEHRYVVESYISACCAFNADDVDGLSETQVGLIIEAVMPRLRGNVAMLSLLFRLIDVDQGGTVNIIEYCRLCGIVMLNFHIIHNGLPEDAPSQTMDSSQVTRFHESKRWVPGASCLRLLQQMNEPIIAFQTAKHALLVTWAEMLKSKPNVQRAVRFFRRFCASKFARLSVFFLLWSHLVLVVMNAQMPPFKQDMEFEKIGVSNNTITYQYRQNLNDVFDIFILVTSIYLVVVLWTQYAFKIAKMNTAMLFIPAELFFVFADYANLVVDDFCLDCIWYARILRSVRAPVIALSLEPFVPLMKAISQLVSTLAVYIAFFYIVLNLFTNLGHLAFRDLGFMHKEVPALSFSTLQQTLTITIELSTADDWDEIRYDLYNVSKQRVYDVFFVFFYIVFNLCTTNVVTSLAIECFEYLHEKEAKHDSHSSGKHQQQAFDMEMHMKNDEKYEMMLAPHGIDEVWTGKNEKHKFVEKTATHSIFSEEETCCLCNKHVGSTVLECSLCCLVVHFDCWQKAEAMSAIWSNVNDIRQFGKISFMHTIHVPTCISKLRFDVLQSHFSVHVKKIVNLLDLLILGPQAPNYESLLEILSEAGQDRRLITFVEGLMYRQIAMDGDADVSAHALQQSSQMWQSLYQSLQSGVVFVKRRHSSPNFKLPTNSGSTSPKNSFRASFARSNSMVPKRSMIDLHKLARRSNFSQGIGLEESMTSRRSSAETLDEGNMFTESSRRGSIDGKQADCGAGFELGRKQQDSLNNTSQLQRLQRRRGSISSPS